MGPRRGMRSEAGFGMRRDDGGAAAPGSLAVSCNVPCTISVEARRRGDETPFKARQVIEGEHEVVLLGRRQAHDLEPKPHRS